MLRTHSSPINSTLRAWLHAEGSLTARLRDHGTVDVVVLRQGAQRLWSLEQMI
jgi:chorismate-pyruvate lyase